MVVTGAGSGCGNAKSMVKAPDPACTGALDPPRGCTFQQPATGSAKYSLSVSPSNRGRRCDCQCQSSWSTSDSVNVRVVSCGAVVMNSSLGVVVGNGCAHPVLAIMRTLSVRSGRFPADVSQSPPGEAPVTHAGTGKFLVTCVANRRQRGYPGGKAAFGPLVSGRR